MSCRIVVMSDTHLSGVTDEFIAICDRHCIDAHMVIHLGDWARAVILDYLEFFPLEAVAGNTDDAIIHSRLPVKKVVSIGGRRLGIIHGWGLPGNLPGLLGHEFTGVDVILFGHTHQPLEVFERGVLLFNPGSVFMGRGRHTRTLGILHIDEDEGTIESEIIRL